MNTETEKLVWAYIDDTLSSQEKTLFEMRLQKDVQLSTYYNDQLRLHTLLKDQKLKTAPKLILSKVLAGIEKDQLALRPKTEFTGFRNIILGLASISITLILVSIFIDSSNSSTSLYQAKILQEFNKVNSFVSIEFIQNYSQLTIYSLVAFILFSWNYVEQFMTRLKKAPAQS